MRRHRKTAGPRLSTPLTLDYSDPIDYDSELGISALVHRKWRGMQRKKIEGEEVHSKLMAFSVRGPPYRDRRLRGAIRFLLRFPVSVALGLSMGDPLSEFQFILGCRAGLDVSSPLHIIGTNSISGVGRHGWPCRGRPSWPGRSMSLCG